MMIGPEMYFNYFCGLLTREKRFTADLTPSHSALPIAALRQVKSGFENRDVNVKVVFLMRDPVERAWSAYRMDKRDGRLNNAYLTRLGLKHLIGAPEDIIMQEIVKTETYQIRGYYDRTIQRIEKIFPSQDIHYGFYEELFTNSSIQSLAKTIGFDFEKPDFLDRANASPKTSSLDDNTQQKIAQEYRSVYRFCASRFGEDRLHKLWPSLRFI